jgi:Mor family transcriptional regulator
MTPDHILARQIGFDEASKLSAEYGGLAHFEIPFGKKAIRAVRDTEIAERYIKGTPIRQLARAYILTERGITKILAKRQIGQEDRQAALF